MAEASPALAAAATPTQRRTGIRLPFGRRTAELSPHSSQLVGLLKLLLPAALRMVNPRYVGLDGENQPYALTADSATQVAGNPDMMQLEQPKADLTMKDGSWVALSAPAGIYDRLRQTVHLSGGVSVFQDTGYAFFSPTADIDLIVGSASGDDPVEGQGPFGNLTAAGFRILDKGHRVIFLGQSHLTLRADSKPPAADPPATNRGRPAAPARAKGAAG